MDINQENINEFLNKYISFVNRISDKNSYPKNLRHVLYLIVPAFVQKYGFNYESTIERCFEEVPIIISEKENDSCTAFFARNMKKNPDGEKPLYYTQKYIVLQQYQNASLIELFDNIIHEMNHAVNSIINEIKYDEKTVSMRTGLVYMTYDRNNLKKVISKDNTTTLEEIINTRQTESLIEIIKNYANFEIDNPEFSSCLYSIKSSISSDYQSNAYLLQSYVCKELMKNKTFIPTVENLRFKGNVDDIPSWFDNITNIDGSYLKLARLLDEILEDEKKLVKVKWFKNIKINKIREKINAVLEIVAIFDKNCVYR